MSVVDDTFIEDEETFDISLTVPPADAASVIFNGADVTTFTIIQDPNDSTLCIVLCMTSPIHCQFCIHNIIWSVWHNAA